MRQDSEKIIALVRSGECIRRRSEIDVANVEAIDYALIKGLLEFSPDGELREVPPVSEELKAARARFFEKVDFLNNVVAEIEELRDAAFPEGSPLVVASTGWPARVVRCKPATLRCCVEYREAAGEWPDSRDLFSEIERLKP